jgi:hypothetical protein
VEQRGIEPLTSALRTRRSAKLSYCPTSEENTVSSFRFQASALGAETPFTARWPEPHGKSMGDVETYRVHIYCVFQSSQLLLCRLDRSADLFEILPAPLRHIRFAAAAPVNH